MAFRVQKLSQDVVSVSVRTVVHHFTFFVHNHTLLIGKGFLGYFTAQKSKPVRLEPEHHLQSIPGDHFKIHGSVITCSAIQSPSRILDLFKELVLAHVF